MKSQHKEEISLEKCNLGKSFVYSLEQAQD